MCECLGVGKGDEGAEREEEWDLGGLLLVGELEFVEAGVDAVEGEKLVVAALFDDAAFVENDDAVGGLDGGQTVRDDEGGTVFDDLLEGFLEAGLGVGID